MIDEPSRNGGFPAGGDDPKQRLLHGALSATRQADVDPAATAATWRALVVASGAEANPPATDEQLGAFETVTGFALPTELAAMLREHNGAEGGFMSVETIIQEWTAQKQFFDESSFEELHGQGSYSCGTDAAQPLVTTPRWIPVLDEKSGNFAGIDLIPGPSGQVGQVIGYGHEASFDVKVLGTDLNDFLQKQLDFVHAEIAAYGPFDIMESGVFYLED